ncbi:MAG: hypothetical protein PHI34_09510 [Acidobacteriota bacterium]|nr:hypothetical protein [Acidobacteriota bacterium]
MERYLMDYCNNYNSKKCQEEIKNARSAHEIKNGDIPLFPSGKEQEKLDKICEKCESRIFSISKKECPLCHGDRFEKIVRSVSISGEDKEKARITFMECAECKSKLKLVEQF